MTNNVFTPKELNLFDTNHSVYSLKIYPSGTEFNILIASKCYSATNTARKPMLLLQYPLFLLKAKVPALELLFQLPPRMKNGLVVYGK